MNTLNPTPPTPSLPDALSTYRKVLETVRDNLEQFKPDFLKQYALHGLLDEVIKALTTSPTSSLQHDYTVVLLRPDYLADDFGTDIYVAQVDAANESDAVSAAQQEAFASDTKDEMEPNAPDDYALCVLFEGRHDPKLFGWQDY